jgi:branched-chain amino acid transport system ATP-binding protein
VLQIQDVHTYYGDSHILQGVSLGVEQGKLVVVLGRNGVGKTTLVRSIVGFTPPRQGSVVFKGRDVTHLPTQRIARMGMGVVPQGHRVFPSLTVLENLQVAARGRNGHGWTLEQVYDLFPRLLERQHIRAGALSGGEQKMLATCQALMANPDFLLLDEPTEGLAPMMIHTLGQTIQQLKQRGISILLVEQHLRFALGLADWVHVMSKGRIVHESSPEELEHNAEIKSLYLGV